MAAAAPARKLTISPTAVVCADAVLEGDVTIGDETVVQPGAVIRALGGPIVIGQRNIVEERATIVYTAAGGAAAAQGEAGGKGKPMVIGSLNVFEVGCHVEDSNVRQWWSGPCRRLCTYRVATRPPAAGRLHARR